MAPMNPVPGQWQLLLEARLAGDWRAAEQAAAADPLLAGLAPFAGMAGPAVIGQIGQSLDGRIAAPNGESRYINGPEALAHLHRLRALCDAVLVGAGAAAADDPSLTVRHVPGPNPVRVVIDPRGRLGGHLSLFSDGGVPAIRIVGQGAGDGARTAGDTCLVLPLDAGGRMKPATIIEALAERGLTRLLVEGGADTLGGFLAAGLLDRLHILTGPIILGAGTPGIALPGIQRLDQAIRPNVTVHSLGGDTLFDCGFR